MPLIPKTQRRRAGALLAAMLLTSTSVMANQRCAEPADQAYFEITALKTELMVLALTCQEDQRYNDFIRRYQPSLVEANRGFTSHFTRVLGRAAQRQSDAYITSLANARQQGAQVLGSDFCPRNRILFEEVAALGSAAELPAYAAGKDLIPVNLGACVAPPAPTRARARR